MQINSLSNIATDLGIGQSGPKAPSSQGRNCPQDQVSISSLASQMSSDPSKLSQLQASYEAGTYNVSPSQIANSILNEAMLS